MNQAELDQALATLAVQKDIWATLPPGERFHHLMEIRRKIGRVAQRWVELAVAAKGIDPDSPWVGEEWSTGPWSLLHGVNRYLETLHALEHGVDPLEHAGHTRTRPDGQVIVKVAPINGYEALFLSGVSAEVWMEPEVTLDTLRDTVAAQYKQPAKPGKVSLVLGAGNVSSIAPMDVLHKLIAESQVCLLKLNPVNDYLEPIFNEIFASLIAYGFVRMATGDADVGAYLARHPDIDEIHITGSAATYDAIVFGTGEDSARRKAENRPATTKRVTCELGNVSPVIVVPGPWSDADVRFQAENIVSQKMHNGGFNCIGAQTLITAAGWKQGPFLMGQVRRLLRTLPERRSYYPGAGERQRQAVGAFPQAEQMGPHGKDAVRSSLITRLNPADKQCAIFTQETFAPVLGQTSLPAPNPLDFLNSAVDFCNGTLSGTLGATILIHPKTRREMGDAFEDAIARLRYGAIGVNVWIGLGFSLSQTAWGAFPGHEPGDVQSGIGKVHNTFLFAQPQKSVIYGPFHPFPRGMLHGEFHILPKPPWYVTNRTAHKTARRLTYFELEPGLRHLPGIITSALRG